MKQFFIQLNVAIALLLVFSFHCQGADKYTLKYNLEKGKTYKQHSISDMNMTMSVMGQDMKMNMKMDIGINYNVTDQNNGIYDIQMTYQRMKMNMSSLPASFSFDSDSMDNSSDNNNIADVFKSIKETPIDIQLTQQGKVASVKGVDKLVEKINSISNDQSKQIFTQQFSEQTIQKMIEQISSYFPDKPVAINDNWDVDTSLSSNGIDIINKTTLTLKQVANNVATIELAGTLATPEGGATTQINGMDAKISVTGTQTGTIQLDMKTGWFVRSDAILNFTQNIEIMGQTMPQQVEAKTTITAD